MFRPWLRVARPDDWTGALARVGLWPIYLLALLAVGLVRIPSSWWLFGFPPLTRAIAAVVTIYLLSWLRMIVWTLIPGAVIQYGRRLWFRHRGRRTRVQIADITAIEVEQRPPPAGETFVLEIGDAVYDMCPVHWDGAPRIYAVVARRVRWARQRADRREARARRKAARAKGDGAQA